MVIVEQAKFTKDLLRELYRQARTLPHPALRTFASSQPLSSFHVPAASLSRSRHDALPASNDGTCFIA